MSEMTIGYWVLWFVFSMSQNQVMHVPVDPPKDGPYQTEAACKKDMPGLLKEAKILFPKDKSVRVYCKRFNPEEKII